MDGWNTNFSNFLLGHFRRIFRGKLSVSKKSPTGPTEQTPKPKYLIARSQLTERGGLGSGPIQCLIIKGPLNHES